MQIFHFKGRDELFTITFVSIPKIMKVKFHSSPILVFQRIPSIQALLIQDLRILLIFTDFSSKMKKQEKKNPKESRNIPAFHPHF